MKLIVINPFITNTGKLIMINLFKIIFILIDTESLLNIFPDVAEGNQSHNG